MLLFIIVAGLNLTAIPDRVAQRWIEEVENEQLTIGFDEASFTGITGLNVRGLSINSKGERGITLETADVTVDVQLMDLLSGKIGKGPMDVTMNDGVVNWGKEAGFSEVAFEKAKVRLGRDQSGWQVDDATVVAYGGTIVSSGRVEMERGFDLHVTVEGVRLPEDLPLFTGSGMRGTADFDGVLAGDLKAPTLTGRMTLSDGTVWNRPVTSGEGDIVFTKGQFTFDNTILSEGHARYDLVGEVLTGGESTTLGIEIAAVRGRLEELLSAFGLPPDLRGDVDGTIDLSGPTGSLTVTGNVAGKMINVADSLLVDRAEGRFAWSDGNLEIGELSVAFDEGDVTLSGDVSEESLNVAIAAVDWPIDRRMGHWLPLPEGVGGRLGFTGYITGSVREPYVTGRMTGGYVDVGRLTLKDPQGTVTATSDTLTATGLTVNSVGEGTYVVDGTVTGLLRGNPLLDLSIDVKGASLSAILAENGVGWPALLVDGLVSGHVAMNGDPAKPNALFDFALGDGEEGEAFALSFSLDEGRVQLGNLPLLLGRDGLSLGGVLQSVESLKDVLS